MSAQRLALTGGYPDGIWTCAWCAAELKTETITHRDDCRWIAEVTAEAVAAERDRIRQLADKHCAEAWADPEAASEAVPFADLIGGAS